MAQAHAAGMFQDPEERADLLHDPDFAALHLRPDFQLLMMDQRRVFLPKPIPSDVLASKVGELLRA